MGLALRLLELVNLSDSEADFDIITEEWKSRIFLVLINGLIALC